MSKPSRHVASAQHGQRAAMPPPDRPRVSRASGSSEPAESQTRRPPAYPQALALYEQALTTLQQRDYPKAAELLRQMIAQYPQERELLDRSRLYMALCERHLQPRAGEPGNTQERLYAATLALNAGNADRAIEHLTRVLDEEPANDRALYLLAVAYSERGEARVAIPYLEQAIAANPENRSLARTDPDLAALRRDSAVSALLGAPAPPSAVHLDGRDGRR